MKTITTILLAAFSASAFSAVPNTFEAGQVATAAAFNENFENLDGRVEALENAAGVPQQQQLVTYEYSGEVVGKEWVLELIPQYTHSLYHTYYYQGDAYTHEEWRLTDYYLSLSNFEVQHMGNGFSLYPDGIYRDRFETEIWITEQDTFSSEAEILEASLSHVDFIKVADATEIGIREVGLKIIERRLNMPDGSTLILQMPVGLDRYTVDLNSYGVINPLQTLTIDGFDFAISASTTVNGHDVVVGYALTMKLAGGMVYIRTDIDWRSATLQELDDFIDHIRVSVEPAL